MSRTEGSWDRFSSPGCTADQLQGRVSRLRISHGLGHRGVVDRGDKICRKAPTSPRGAAADIHEVGCPEDGLALELQHAAPETRYQAYGPVTPIVSVPSVSSVVDLTSFVGRITTHDL